MLSLRGRPDPVVAQQQYAVVLVNEDQLDHLLNRPAVKQVGPRALYTRNLYARYGRMKRGLAVVGVVILVVAASVTAWAWVPRPALTSMLPWKAQQPPTLATGASFSVALATQGGEAAAVTADKLRESGIPAFTRSADGALRQVMVGPFASLDEAEGAQRHLRGIGAGSGRVFVDESLRHIAPAAMGAIAAEGNAGVVLLGAPERMSLVLELPIEPRQVSTRRPSETALDIDVGPMPMPVRAQQWRVPEGVDLLRQVAIEEFNEPGSGRYLRARVSLTEFARPAVRAEGKRVYLDLTPAGAVTVAPEATAAADRQAPPADRAASAPPAAAAPSAATRADEATYRDALRPSLARFEELSPFLIRAAQNPSDDVLGALGQTLASLDGSLTGLKVPRAIDAEHERLLTAVRSARRAMDPAFSGDRLAQVHHALGLYQLGNAPVTVTPAVP